MKTPFRQSDFFLNTLDANLLHVNKKKASFANPFIDYNN